MSSSLTANDFSIRIFSLLLYPNTKNKLIDLDELVRRNASLLSSSPVKEAIDSINFHLDKWRSPIFIWIISPFKDALTITQKALFEEHKGYIPDLRKLYENCRLILGKTNQNLKNIHSSKSEELFLELKKCYEMAYSMFKVFEYISHQYTEYLDPGKASPLTPFFSGGSTLSEKDFWDSYDKTPYTVYQKSRLSRESTRAADFRKKLDTYLPSDDTTTLIEIEETVSTLLEKITSSKPRSPSQTSSVEIDIDSDARAGAGGPALVPQTASKVKVCFASTPFEGVAALASHKFQSQETDDSIEKRV